MIQKLVQTDNFRSYLATQTGDVIMQGNPDDKLLVMKDGTSFFMVGYYEVIIRHNGTLTGHIQRKRAVVRCLRGYAQKECETLSEGDLDGILRDYASAHKREVAL